MKVSIYITGFKELKKYFNELASSKIAHKVLETGVKTGSSDSREIARSLTMILPTRKNAFEGSLRKSIKAKVFNPVSGRIKYEHHKLDLDYFPSERVTGGIKFQLWANEAPFVIKGAGHSTMKSGKKMFFARIAKVKEKRQKRVPGTKVIEYRTKSGKTVRYILKARTTAQREAMRHWKWKDFQQKMDKKHGKAAPQYRTHIMKLQGASVKGLFLKDNGKLILEVKDNIIVSMEKEYNSIMLNLMKQINKKSTTQEVKP